jgi:hypothetical protein
LKSILITGPKLPIDTRTPSGNVPFDQSSHYLQVVDSIEDDEEVDAPCGSVLEPQLKILVNSVAQKVVVGESSPERIAQGLHQHTQDVHVQPQPLRCRIE